MVPITLIDYGAGNPASVIKAFAAVGATVTRAAAPGDLAGARALVIPGVGHFGATAVLGDDWRDAIQARIDAGAAVLGICLGMQWLFDGSEEAPRLAGLGIFTGRCRRLPDAGVKVPHVGWNTLSRAARPSRLLDGLAPDVSVYFTHSFAAPLGADTVGTSIHGIAFAAAVERGRVMGTQFHPEKSGAHGIRLLAGFSALAAEGR